MTHDEVTRELADRIDERLAEIVTAGAVSSKTMTATVPGVTKLLPTFSPQEIERVWSDLAETDPSDRISELRCGHAEFARLRRSLDAVRLDEMWRREFLSLPPEVVMPPGPIGIPIIVDESVAAGAYEFRKPRREGESEADWRARWEVLGPEDLA